MKKIMVISLAIIFSIFTISAASLADAETTANTAVSAIYSGGPSYLVSGTLSDLKASGFNTLIQWSLHIDTSGNLKMNDETVCTNGSYTGQSAWSNQWLSYKSGTTSIERLEISVGAGGTTDFASIKALCSSGVPGTDSNLYKNMLALKNATGADAINLDTEDTYDSISTINFCKMCINMGYSYITLCPYTNTAYWKAVKDGLEAWSPGVVDRIYLQCYDGGSGNNPGTWKTNLGMPVIPGLWCTNTGKPYYGKTPAQVQSQLTSWNASYGIAGGFIWLYDDIRNNNLSTAAYASAINNSFGPVTPTPTPIPGNLAFNKSVSANQYVTGETPALAVDGTVANNSKWCSTTDIGAQWLRIDLGSEVTVSRWIVKHAGEGGETSGYNTRDFTLQKSTDGNSWTDVDSVAGNTANSTDRTVTPFSARYVRLYITNPQTSSSNKAARIYEIELY